MRRRQDYRASIIVAAAIAAAALGREGAPQAWTDGTAERDHAGGRSDGHTFLRYVAPLQHRWYSQLNDPRE